MRRRIHCDHWIFLNENPDHLSQISFDRKGKVQKSWQAIVGFFHDRLQFWVKFAHSKMPRRIFLDSNNKSLISWSEAFLHVSAKYCHRSPHHKRSGQNCEDKTVRFVFWKQLLPFGHLPGQTVMDSFLYIWDCIEIDNAARAGSSPKPRSDRPTNVKSVYYDASHIIGCSGKRVDVFHWTPRTFLCSERFPWSKSRVTCSNERHDLRLALCLVFSGRVVNILPFFKRSDDSRATDRKLGESSAQ
jgi:hypothetical protein